VCVPVPVPCIPSGCVPASHTKAHDKAFSPPHPFSAHLIRRADKLERCQALRKVPESSVRAAGMGCWQLLACWCAAQHTRKLTCACARMLAHTARVSHNHARIHERKLARTHARTRAGQVWISRGRKGGGAVWRPPRPQTP